MELNKKTNKMGLEVLQSIPAIVNLGGFIYDSIKEGQARKEELSKQKDVLGKQNELASYLYGESKKDVFDNDYAKANISRLREAIKDSNTRTTTNAARTGGTAEAEIAQKSANQDQYNEALMKIAGYGQQRNDALRSQYANSLGTIFSMNDKVYGDYADRWGNAAMQSGNAFSSSFSTMLGK